MKIWWFILLGVAIFLCIYYKVKIHFKSFFKKGFIAKRGPYGCYCYFAPQGQGKSYGIASYVYDHKDSICLFSNIKFNNPIEYEYFNGFDQLVEVKKKLDNGYNTKGKQIVIVFDELFTELTKGTRLSTEVLDFMAQLRKRKIIFLTTCQSWPDLPLQFRRLCRYAFQCRMITIPFITSLHLLTVKDAENMKWDELKQDFDAPICWTDVYKTRKVVSAIYDTNQRITKD